MEISDDEITLMIRGLKDVNTRTEELLEEIKNTKRNATALLIEINLTLHNVLHGTLEKIRHIWSTEPNIHIAQNQIIYLAINTIPEIYLLVECGKRIQKVLMQNADTEKLLQASLSKLS